MCECVCVHMPWCTNGDQRTICDDQFSPSTMRIPGLNSGLLTWRQVPLSTEPSHWLQMCFFTESPCRIFDQSPSSNIAQPALTNRVHSTPSHMFWGGGCTSRTATQGSRLRGSGEHVLSPVALGNIEEAEANDHGDSETQGHAVQQVVGSSVQ